MRILVPSELLKEIKEVIEKEKNVGYVEHHIAVTTDEENDFNFTFVDNNAEEITADNIVERTAGMLPTLTTFNNNEVLGFEVSGEDTLALFPNSLSLTVATVTDTTRVLF